MAQNWATVRPEAGKRASRSIQSWRVAARDRVVGWTGGATTVSDIGIPPRERATPRSYPMRQERDLAGAYPQPSGVRIPGHSGFAPRNPEWPKELGQKSVLID